MDSGKVNVLIAALEAGSMSAAAEALGYTTSGVSQMITAIENELGFPLITRGRGGIALTKAGEEVYPALLAYSRADSNIRQIASELRGLSDGRLLIGAFSSIAANWLPGIIRRFKADYPGISISILEGIHHEIDRWMATTKMDFCMYSERPGMDTDWIPLYHDPMLVVVPPQHPFAGRSAVSPQELDGEPFIMPGRGKDLDVVELLDRFQVKPDIRYITLENYSALSMVEAGLGISVMNELITKGRLNRVVMVPFDPPQSITLGIAAPDLKALSPAARKFIQYVREELGS